MKSAKPRKRCVISPERIRVNDTEPVPAFGEPPVAIDALCGRCGSPDPGLAEEPGANAILALAHGFREIPHPFLPASGRGRPFRTAFRARDRVAELIVCNRAGEPTFYRAISLRDHTGVARNFARELDSGSSV